MSRLTPEGIVKRATKELLQRHGAYIHMPVQTRFGKKTVDILACVYGMFIAIETKKDRTGKPTPLQESTLAAVRAAGGETFVVLAVDDLGLLAEWLEHIKEVHEAMAKELDISEVGENWFRRARLVMPELPEDAQDQADHPA